MTEKQGPVLIGDFSTPDLFADEATYFNLINGTVRITLSVARSEQPVEGSTVGLVAIGRLVMTVQDTPRAI